MKKVTKVTLYSIVTICLLGFSGYLFWTHAFPSTPEQDKIADERAKKAEKVKQFYESLEDKNAVQANGDSAALSGEGIMTAEQAEVEFPIDMKEQDVQNAIHHMSHQKVKADKKRGKLQITPERIARLIDVIEQNDYDNKNVYLDILYAWQDG